MSLCKSTTDVGNEKYKEKQLSANELTNKIIDFLYRQGAFSWRQNTGGVFDKRLGIYRASSKKGVADILAVVPPTGQLVAIEIKIGKDRLSPEQEGFLLSVKHAGGNTFIAHNFEEFQVWWKVQYPCA